MQKKRPSFVKRAEGVITKNNALARKATSEKWMFVTDLINACGIGYDPLGNNIDRMVASVERRLENVLTEGGAV